MARAQFFVVNHDGEWKIKHDGVHVGRYDTQKAASRAAIDKAYAYPGDAQVLVQGVDGKFRTEWTYGNDPYPPRG